MIQLPLPSLSNPQFDVRRYLYQTIDNLNRFLRENDNNGFKVLNNIKEDLPNIPLNVEKGIAAIIGSGNDHYYILIGSTGDLWTGVLLSGDQNISWYKK